MKKKLLTKETRSLEPTLIFKGVTQIGQQRTQTCIFEKENSNMGLKHKKWALPFLYGK